MTLLNAGALALLALAGGIVLLYFLRARSRRVEVPVLFLWEGLRSDPRSRAARLRRRIEPLLLVQLLVLALMTFALAQPALRGLRPHLSGMAIVLDASASMRTRTESEKTRYDLAREGGLALLDEFPSTPVTILQLSRASKVLVPLTEDHDEARQALGGSQPTWYGDGTAEVLQGLLASQGGLAAFERVVLLTDRPVDPPLPGVEQVIFDGGENVAITAFTVREDNDGGGSTAFVKIRNDSGVYQERVVRISDGAHSVMLSALLPPGDAQGYALPFPGSRGPSFTATLGPEDAFAVDDNRTFTPHRGLERRVRWIGEPNRYLQAALAAASPIITLVPADDPDPVDLTVAYNAQLPAETSGNILLVHAGLESLITIGDEVQAGKLTVADPNDPLLVGVDPLGFRVRTTPQVTLPEAGTIVLALGDVAFLYRLEEEDRNIVLVAPDLLRSNLPLTVDFPLLVRNVLETFSPLPAAIIYAWSIVGEPIQLDGYGTVVELEDPSGRKLALSSGADSFIPQVPGIYTLRTERGTHPLAVNVDPAESEPAGEVLLSDAAGAVEEKAQTLHPFWPYLAGVGFLALLFETGLYHGWHWRRRI